MKAKASTLFLSVDIWARCDRKRDKNSGTRESLFLGKEDQPLKVAPRGGKRQAPGPGPDRDEGDLEPELAGGGGVGIQALPERIEDGLPLSFRHDLPQVGELEAAEERVGFEGRGIGEAEGEGVVLDQVEHEARSLC